MKKYKTTEFALMTVGELVTEHLRDLNTAGVATFEVVSTNGQSTTWAIAATATPPKRSNAPYTETIQ